MCKGVASFADDASEVDLIRKTAPNSLIHRRFLGCNDSVMSNQMWRTCGLEDKQISQTLQTIALKHQEIDKISWPKLSDEAISEYVLNNKLYHLLTAFTLQLLHNYKRKDSYCIYMILLNILQDSD